MSSPFQRSIDSVFRRFGVDAAYTPPRGGAPMPCRAVFTQGDKEWRFREAGASTPARIAEVRASEVPVMEEEGTLTIGGRTCVIGNATQPDADRLVWRLELQ
ncbi:hypothetical protein TSH58p_22685 (plasmid) [Azospirillum sp. TSH58]|uniref:head-tail joining protein n=1 Tax=Azospirillum sp. TSH58 TaxID=664962 RepID=UPI000D602CB1|nr:hypothetical protein [Azospirillum sp. TSH58]AWJ86325.1 hypothetical protein TSH58p_22685 [Azospirillum sp. TSH58]PWC73425.1 hypothetical protein TSH58_04430 [Azospirillum sp. TSH58]